MAKKRNDGRRSISVKGITYQRLRNYLGKDGSVSGCLEKLVKEKLDKAGAPVPTKADLPKPKEKPEPDDDGGQHFSF